VAVGHPAGVDPPNSVLAAVPLVASEPPPAETPETKLPSAWLLFA